MSDEEQKQDDEFRNGKILLSIEVVLRHRDVIDVLNFLESKGFEVSKVHGTDRPFRV
jgi:hypothetical protein